MARRTAPSAVAAGGAAAGDARARSPPPSPRADIGRDADLRDHRRDHQRGDRAALHRLCRQRAGGDGDRHPALRAGQRGAVSARPRPARSAATSTAPIARCAIPMPIDPSDFRASLGRAAAAIRTLAMMRTCSVPPRRSPSPRFCSPPAAAAAAAARAARRRTPAPTPPPADRRLFTDAGAGGADRRRRRSRSSPRRVGRGAGAQPAFAASSSSTGSATCSPCSR